MGELCSAQVFNAAGIKGFTGFMCFYTSVITEASETISRLFVSVYESNNQIILVWRRKQIEKSSNFRSFSSNLPTFVIKIAFFSPCKL